MVANKNLEAGFVLSTLQKCLNTWKSKKEGSFHVEYKEGRLSIKYSLGVPDANQTRHRRDGRRSVNRTSRDNNTPKAPRRNRTREIKRKKSANRILRDNARAAERFSKDERFLLMIGSQSKTYPNLIAQWAIWGCQSTFCTVGY